MRSCAEMACGAMVFLAVLMPLAEATDIPGFDQFDKDLSKYKNRAELEGDTNAQLDFEGLPYYALFDLFLTVMANPDHPYHAETRDAWEHNRDTYRSQARMVSMGLGKAMIPLLLTSSEDYCVAFRDNTTKYAPRFAPADYRQPVSKKVKMKESEYRLSWFHPLADADGDGITNRDELLAIAPNWRRVKQEDGSLKPGTGIGVTEAERDRFVQEALGLPSWRVSGTKKGN